ncbi:MAG: prepilin-type N-terminal cleavage/methylation domain-containing protein [Lachnospiraceae bacterium]|nr:prepilin-type N-terminal cleavage/methylation domain-containing protein [Lachnospiraceae bacterium]
MRKKNSFQLNNRGISLTELIVVIAITAVLAGGGITLMGLIPRTQVNGCVQDFAGTMNRVKTNTMSFQEVKVELYQDSTGVYMQVYKGSDAEDPVLIGEKGVCVKAVIGGLEQELNGKRLKLSYDRSSGAFNDVEIVGGGASGECSSITFYKGITQRTATLVKLTGKISY